MIWHNRPLKKPKSGKQITFNYISLRRFMRKKPTTPKLKHPDGVLTQTINKWIVKVIKISKYKHQKGKWREKKKLTSGEREMYLKDKRCWWKPLFVAWSHHQLKNQIAFWFLKNQNGVSLYIVEKNKTNWKREEDESDDEPTANCIRKREISVKRTWHRSVPNQ